MLEVRLIGTFDVKWDDKPVAISSRTAQSLFAYLILNAGTSYRREKLAGMFWPDATEEKARAYLRHELWRIRKAIPSNEFLLSDDIGIIFNSYIDYRLDADVLKKLTDSASADDLMVGLSAYQGELLPGFYDEWIVLEREHLQSVFEHKMARLLELLVKEKRWREILGCAERWISFGQGPESAYRYLMIAYDALEDRAKVASTYERCVQALRELGLEPSEETRALALKRSYKLNISIPLTSFIGRETEIKEVAALLSKSRLVTLTGSGGVGKTRLAIQAVGNVLEQFPDGVWFLDLAPLSDPTRVPNTLANLLGLRESGELPIPDLLVNYFRSRTALVIFDNCEHLIESCAQLVNLLLTSCENLCVLATSREVLRVSGEVPYRVPSLEIPSSGIEFAIDGFSKIESVKLFVERAAVASPGFAISSLNVLIIAQICQRLDGIPLAIELAAARVNVLTVEQILKRLDDRFNLLTSGLRSALPRHQTLRATIEWSYDLLSERERILFRRLAVFIGGWTLEAEEEVCTGDDITSGEVLEILSRLANKSLVIANESQHGSRYRMLETVRQFANEKLVESYKNDFLRDKHLKFFLNLAETAEPHLIRPEQIEWLPLLDADYENLRLALEWALNKETDGLALRLCRALWWFWKIRGYWLEGLNWVKRALAKPSENEDINEKIARARVLYTHAELEWQLANFERILDPAQASFALASEVSDKKDIAIARFYVGVALRTVDRSQALSAMKQSFSEFEALNEIFWQAYSHPFLGDFLVEERELKRRDKFITNVELARKAGERSVLADVLSFYAYWLFNNNQSDEAWERAKESDKLYKQIGAESGGINSFVFARIAWFDGNFQEARSLYMELIERLALLGEKGFRSDSTAELGLLAMEQGNLHQAQTYLEQALALAHGAGREHKIALRLTELSNLFYLQGNLKDFRQNARDGLSFKNYFLEDYKAQILEVILGSLYIQKPENSTRILGAIDRYSESEYGYPIDPIYKRYCDRAEIHAYKTLGDTVFESLFAEGRKMSLDEARDLAVRTVEEM